MLDGILEKAVEVTEKAKEITETTEKVAKIFNLSEANAVLEKANEMLGKSDEVIKKYYTDYKERLDYTPKDNRERGTWTGDRGESMFIPKYEYMQKALEKYGSEGIEYRDGLPDFSKCSIETVEIDMTSERYTKSGNFEKCDTQLASLWNEKKQDGRNDWKPREVAEWRSDNKLTWHESADMKTCNLLETKIHEYFSHSGGVAECKKKEALSGILEEVYFDE